MRITSRRLKGLFVLGFLLGGSGPARAEFMDWSYQWSISPKPVLASGTGTVALALGRGGSGAPNLLAADVTTNSIASSRRPDRFNSGFNLTLHLTDRATHQSGALTFQGRITGTLTATDAHLSETFRVPVEHITLGGHIYWVSLPNQLTLLPPGAANVPELRATVRVVNAQQPPPRPRSHALVASVSLAGAASIPPAAATPEPPAFALAGAGIVLLGAVCGWRCRRAALPA